MLTAMLVMEFIGIAIMIVWFIVLVRSGFFERVDEALRRFLSRNSRRP